jgi:hypothetical protein
MCRSHNQIRTGYLLPCIEIALGILFLDQSVETTHQANTLRASSRA